MSALVIGIAMGVVVLLLVILVAYLLVERYRKRIVNMNSKETLEYAAANNLLEQDDAGLQVLDSLSHDSSGDSSSGADGPATEVVDMDAVEPTRTALYQDTPPSVTLPRKEPGEKKNKKSKRDNVERL